MTISVGTKVRLWLIGVLSVAGLGWLLLSAHLIGRESTLLREQLISIGLHTLRIAAVNGELTPERLTSELGFATGFAMAAYDADGRLLMVSRGDVEVPDHIDRSHLAAADARPGAPEFLERVAVGEDNVAIMGANGPGKIRYLGITDRWATRRINRALLQGLLFGLPFTALVGVVAFRGIRWGVQRRLRLANLLADNIAGNQFEGPLPDLGDDEVGQLARRFRTMAEALHREQTVRLRSFADWAHEISTPLTSVLGYLESLGIEELAADPEIRRRYLRTAYEQAQALRALADDLSTLSQLDFEGLPLERTRVDLAALAERESAAMAPSARIIVDCSPVEVDGDPLRLAQVLRNLLSNAVRHSPPGKPIIIRGGEGRTSAWLEVEDEGPGIAPEQLAHLGERFYRVDASRNRASGGRGLGLAISRGIVESHGGRLQFRSVVGAGTVARVELPAVPRT